MNNTKNEKLVSAIITSYNRDFSVLKRALNSVINQTYQNIEIIIIDDNDLDNKFHLSLKDNIAKYRNVKYYHMGNNQGSQKARNKGIELAHGIYIAFLDDDDEWMPTKIEEQVKCFNTNKNIGLVFSKGYDYNDENNKKTIYNLPGKSYSFDDLLFHDTIGSTSQALILKEVFDNVGVFDIEMPARQDYEMWIRISKIYECYKIEKPLFIHHNHNCERISTNTEKVINGYKKIYKKYFIFYKTRPLSRSHIFFQIFLLNKKNHLIKSFKYLFLSFFYLVVAFFYNPSEILKRIKEI